MATNSQMLDTSSAVNARGGNLATMPGNYLTNIRSITAQPSFQRAFPAIIAVTAIVICIVVFALMQKPSEQRFMPHYPRRKSRGFMTR